MRRPLHVVASVFFFVVLLVASRASANAVIPRPIFSSSHAGALDPTFGRGGKVLTDINANRVGDVALQRDGKLVVAGTIDNFVIATETFGIVRYLPNGALDTTFGQGGAVLTAFTNFINSANALAIQPDGKIVVAGEASSADGRLDEIAVARYTTNGSLDSSFGNGGKVTTNFFGFRNAANVILLQPDGKIIVGGMAGNVDTDGASDLVLARYNNNGTPDMSFGNAGKAYAGFGTGFANALALQSDGKIVAAGRVFAVRFLSNGSLDSNLAGGTIIALSHTASSSLQSDRKIIFAGARTELNRHDVDVMLGRFTLNGSVDPTFFTPTFDFGIEGFNVAEVAQAIGITPDGKYVTGGEAQVPGGVGFGVARLLSDGTLDASFGNGGKLTTTFLDGSLLDALLVQPDGKIVGVGTALNQSTSRSEIAVARYLGR